ncbi:GNAT family N-acetyltransferase [Corynebacterium glyciniphilum]|uniref:GNAT family N-acetyltransferase n=1 Tax=Corynebacterium glyciniphilum TaxID=1404244 RepID=UPI0034E969CF
MTPGPSHRRKLKTGHRRGDPRHRGNGFGTALIRHALDALDAVSGARTPVHLETSDARNVELYSRFGFATHAETHPFDGPVVWSMQRE